MFGGLLLVSAIFNVVYGEYTWCEDLSTHHGELRSYDEPSTCFEANNTGNFMDASSCLGWSMNLFMYCDDLTIRSFALDTCLQNMGDDGTLQFQPCIPNSNDQLWGVGTEGDFIDDYGVTQVKVAFRSFYDNNCLWGPINGRLQTNACNLNDQMYFFFRTKGEVTRSGYMVSNENRYQCVQIDTSSPSLVKVVDVITKPCGPGNVANDSVDVWDLYETGELVNSGNGCCMNWNWNHTGSHIDGELFTDACDYGNDKVWRTLGGIRVGHFYQGTNSLCMSCAYNLNCNVNGTDGVFCGTVSTSACSNVESQRFLFVTDDWTPVRVTSKHRDL